MTKNIESVYYKGTMVLFVPFPTNWGVWSISNEMVCSLYSEWQCHFLTTSSMYVKYIISNTVIVRSMKIKKGCSATWWRKWIWASNISRRKTTYIYNPGFHYTISTCQGIDHQVPKKGFSSYHCNKSPDSHEHGKILLVSSLFLSASNSFHLFSPKHIWHFHSSS